MRKVLISHGRHICTPPHSSIPASSVVQAQLRGLGLSVLSSKMGVVASHGTGPSGENALRHAQLLSLCPLGLALAEV